MTAPQQAERTNTKIKNKAPTSKKRKPANLTNKDTTNAPKAAVKPVTKKETVLNLLKQENGASLEELMKATSWQAHTVRAALTRARQSGFAVERMAQTGGKPSRYRVRGEEA